MKRRNRSTYTPTKQVASKPMLSSEMIQWGVEELRMEVARYQKVVGKFREYAASNDPSSALRNYAEDAVRAEAKARIYSLLLKMIQEGRPFAEAVEQLLPEAEREVLGAAKYPPSSSNPIYVMVEQAEDRAWAEFLEHYRNTPQLIREAPANEAEQLQQQIQRQLKIDIEWAEKEAADKKEAAERENLRAV